MFKVNNKDAGVVMLFLLLTRKYFTPCTSVSIVNFEHVEMKKILEKVCLCISC